MTHTHASPRVAISILGFALAIVAQITHAQTTFEQDCDKLASGNLDASERLNRLFDLHWKYALLENPESATELGYAGQNDRWADISLDIIARRERELRAPLKVLQSIPRERLNAPDQLNYDLFKKNIDDALAGVRFKDELIPLTQMNGVQQDIARIIGIAPRDRVKDYEDIIARLNAVPELIDQTLVLLNKGVEEGVTPPRITLRDVPQQVLNQIVEDPDQSPMLKPFREFPAAISEAERIRLRREAAAALKERVLPAFRKLHEFLVKTYVPRARETIGASDLPEGRAWYEHNARMTTTTSLTPQQIHELGLTEVKRIRGEMEKVIAQTGFQGSFRDFTTFLRKDSRFYYTDTESLLRGYRDISKRVDPELARLFGRLPRLPYGVIAIPDYAAKSQTTAYYQPGSPTTGRPGYFYANTYALEMRPTWEMEALTLHEAVPGHHLQIALAQEMENLPEFRKHAGYTAFVEGWALYAESLGTEMGLYKDPYSKFGQLVYEMWRAIRLVVDTGMHTMGWTRQQAIDFFLANTSKTEQDVIVEVDRYIVWPGQALAYKIGELKIKELRAMATRELGDRFNIREFHDQVLGNGAVPLDILEQNIKGWISAKKSRASSN